MSGDRVPGAVMALSLALYLALYRHCHCPYSCPSLALPEHPVYALAQPGVPRVFRVDHGTPCTPGTPCHPPVPRSLTHPGEARRRGVGEAPGLTPGCTGGQTSQACQLAR